MVRPLKNDSAKTDVKVQVLFSSEQYNILKWAADAQGLSISSFIRQIVIREIVE